MEHYGYYKHSLFCTLILSISNIIPTGTAKLTNQKLKNLQMFQLKNSLFHILFKLLKQQPSGFFKMFYYAY